MRSSPDILIARSFGIVTVAAGFMAGMYGLDHPDTLWLKTALGLIATGLLAQGYALIRTVVRATGHHDERHKP
ncbi:MAG: hypothetical protein D6704_11490 [Nitrospirae bacterium]|nr:MAG: hypothetical protein D6704_11490 [Nitrospirota bacterium]